MKKTFLHSSIIAVIAISILCLIGFKSSAQIKKDGKNFTVEYSQAKGNDMNLLFTTGDIKITERTEGGITYSSLNYFKGAVTYKKGYAELPIFSASIQLAPDKNVTMTVENGSYTDYNLQYPLLPSRGSIYRNQDPSKISYEIDPASIVDAWYPVDNATMVDPFIIRDVRGTSVYVYPIQYNAAKKILRVYNTINVKLTENTTTPINPLTNVNKKINNEMIDVYKSTFINFNTNTRTSWTNEVGETGSILVICTARDSAVINPYILWKRQMGYKVTKQVVATGTNIVTNVKNAYTSDPSIFYVLLVGGWADIKCATSSSSPEDPMVGCVVGTDNYPDIIVGRFCTNSGTTHITTQVNKTITYEKTPTVGGTWYKTALGVASNKGPGDDNELDYQHIGNIWRGRYSPYTYNKCDSVWDNPAGYATPAMVSSAVNPGVGVVNFSGDGAETEWAQSSFSVTNVNALTNGDKLPFVISVSCVVGSYQTPVCFAESWLEKSGGGGIAFLGSTINQDWDPPMAAQDYMADILVGGYNYALGSAPVHPDHQKTHFGSITLNGKILMYTEYSTASNAEMLNWCLFGDPSLQVRTDTPKNITLSDSTITAGLFTTNVKVNGAVFPNALVSIWDGANQPFSGYTDASGNVTITHTLALGKAVTLTVTGFNLYPKIINTTITSATALPTENVFSNTVSVYPIPASKNITVSIDNSINGKYTFEILNTLGQVVFTDVIEKNSTSFTKNIDLSNILKGVYLMKYSGNGNVGYKKLILN